jgi:hypothetical protein
MKGAVMSKSFMVLSTMVLVAGSWWSGVRTVPEVTPAKPDSDVAAETEDIQVRYARAHLELAQFDLKRAGEYNSIIPNIVNPSEILRLKRHVEFDQTRLEQRLRGEEADVKEFCIRAAETALQVARERVVYEKRMYEHSPSKMGELNVKRAELVATLAGINLERTRQYDPEESVLNYLQWQIEDLRYQMSELHQLH